MEGYDSERAMAEFLRSRPITRCPTACAVRTQASVPEADRLALRDYAEARKKSPRKVIAGRPYVPAPDLVATAQKFGPDYTKEEHRLAAAATLTIIKENRGSGASFAVVAENLIFWGVPTQTKFEWTHHSVRKVLMKDAGPQA